MFWFLGGFIGLSLGLVVVCLLKIAYEKKGQHEKLKKIKGSLSIKIILICGLIGLLTLGYCGRTQLILGDFSDKTCDFRYCDNPSICKFYYNFNGGDYYCEEHISFCNRLTGGNKSTSSEQESHTCYVCGKTGNHKYGSYYYCATHYAMVKTVTEEG